jgi:hypothetical protein
MPFENLESESTKVKSRLRNKPIRATPVRNGFFGGPDSPPHSERPPLDRFVELDPQTPRNRPYPFRFTGRMCRIPNKGSSWISYRHRVPRYGVPQKKPA